jgi:hypothetical protein
MAPILIVSASTERHASGLPLAQYELRCPHCGYEWVANLYGQSDVSAVDFCPTCEVEVDPTPVAPGVAIRCGCSSRDEYG